LTWVVLGLESLRRRDRQRPRSHPQHEARDKLQAKIVALDGEEAHRALALQRWETEALAIGEELTESGEVIKAKIVGANAAAL